MEEPEPAGAMDGLNSSQSQITPLFDLYLNQWQMLLLVFSRLSGLFVTAPVLGSRSVPIRIRGALALGISIVIVPVFWGADFVAPRTMLHQVSVMAVEASLGMVLGLGIMVVLSGLQLAGHLASQMSGLALADVVDPATNASVPVLSRFLELVTLAVFLVIGGHRMVLDALMKTFSWIPPGQGWFAVNGSSAVAELLTESFMLGLRAAGPMILSLTASILILGLISRTLPQLNVMAIGFSVNSILMLATLMLSLGSVAWIFQDRIEPTLTSVLQAIVPMPSS